MKKLKDMPEIAEAIPKTKFEEVDIQIKPIVLLMAYMLDIRKENGLTGEETEKELEIILRAVPSYLDVLIEVSVGLSTLFKWVGQVRGSLAGTS